MTKIQSTSQPVPRDLSITSSLIFVDNVVTFRPQLMSGISLSQHWPIPVLTITRYMFDK